MSRSAAFLLLVLMITPLAALAQTAPVYSQQSPAAEQQHVPAQQPHMLSNSDDKPWSLTLGAGVGYGSLYQGGAKREVIALPVIEATYYNWSLEPVFDGLRYRFINTDEFVMGAGLVYDFGRPDKKDSVPARARGIGDVDGGMTTGLFAEYKLHEILSLLADVTQSYSDAESLLVTVGASSEFPLYGDLLSGNLGVSATWANEDHMRAYYGVNAQQASGSGLRRFNAESGIESVNVSAGMTYMITERWAYTISGGVDLLQGDAADSPIIEDDVQPFIFNAISYTF
jgi:outer membrane protein